MTQNKLIEDNMKLVYFTINKHYPTYINDEDVTSEGMVGLCKAAKYYDESKGEFSTYAVMCIKNTISNYLVKQNSRIKPLSIDYEIPLEEGDGSTFGDTLPDENSEKLFDRLERDIFVSTLNKREQRIINHLYNGLTHREIAKLEGVHTSRISQIISRIKAKWRMLNED